jgi:hypothetical protein
MRLYDIALDVSTFCVYRVMCGQCATVSMYARTHYAMVCTSVRPMFTAIMFVNNIFYTYYVVYNASANKFFVCATYVRLMYGNVHVRDNVHNIT